MIKKFIFFIFIALVGFVNANPETHTTDSNKTDKLDINHVIFGHIQDAHDFHFFTYGHFHASLPLPVIIYSPQKGLDIFMSSNFNHGHSSYLGYKLVKEKIVAVDAQDNILSSIQIYDLSLTKNVIQMLLALSLFLWVILKVKAMYISKKISKNKITKILGLQSWLEPIILFVRDDVAISNLGVKKGQKYLPFLLTLFFFILINNLFGLIPGSANVTGNIAFTLVLAIFSFIVILFSTNKHFWSHIFWPEGPLLVKLILIPIELAGIFTKPVALMIRLFANMVAGHIIIICFISLIFIFSKLSLAGGVGFSPVSIMFTIFIYVIEILVAFIQAFIFTNLTAVFISQSIGDSHENVEHKKH